MAKWAAVAGPNGEQYIAIVGKSSARVSLVVVDDDIDTRGFAELLNKHIDPDQVDIPF